MTSNRQAATPAIIVIPARYASSRYPGKPLASIRGATGGARPLIQRSHEAAQAVTLAARTVVATDDERIAQAARGFGAEVVMTPESCANGTERVAAAASALGSDTGIFVNFQGDALLTPPDLVDRLIRYMIDHPDCPVATVAVRCSPSAYRYLLADQAAGRAGGTTVVLNDRSEALYFSKRVLPFIAPGHPAEEAPPVLLHIGLYSYRAAALDDYAARGASQLEQLEGLEQLRFLANGIPVAVVVADAPDWDLIELNNPGDLEAIEAILAQRGME